MIELTDTNELINAYGNINTSTIGHITPIGYLANIKAMVASEKIYAGKVMTVTLESDNTDIIRQALIKAEVGDVLCIDARVLDEQACWGALRTCAAIYEKLTAVIILGKVTDSVELKQLAFPIFAMGISSLTTFKSDDAQGRLNTIIHYKRSHYQTQIQSGDIAIMDNDGVFILSKSLAKKHLVACQKKQTEDDKKFQIFLQAYKNDQLDKLFIKQ